MGRLNIRHVASILKGKVLRILPYKYRKPFILWFSILGLIGYYNIVSRISYDLFKVENEALTSVGEACKSIVYTLQNSLGSLKLSAILIVLVLAIMYKYLIVDSDEDRKSKNYRSRSWYYKINTLISSLYLLITILALIPALTKIGG